MRYLQFCLPPLPHYVISDSDVYGVGTEHLSRKSIGVFDLLVVSEGALYMGEGDQRWRVGQGETLILLPNAEHVCWKPCDAVTRFYWAHFQTLGEWKCVEKVDLPAPSVDFYIYSPINQFSIVLPQYTTLSDPQKTYEMMDELNRSRITQSPEKMWEQQMLFQKVLMSLCEAADEESVGAQHKVAGQVVEFLMDNYQRQITNVTISRHLAYHTGYINRCMQQVYGCTALDYLKRYRVERAKAYLTHTSHSMEFVASRTGFSSAVHFGKSFKKKTGMSPQQYRRANQGGDEAEDCTNGEGDEES